MQGGVGSSVAAWVEAVTGGFTAGCGNGGGGAQVGEWTAGCFSDSTCFVFQAALVKSRKSRSTSLGVRYPRAE